jgi:glycosyltransferase involved in cell wall biosynthesis
MTWTVWKVFREALRQRADVYQFHDPELIPACILLQLCGKRVIYDIHEDVPKDILSKDYLPSWSRQPLSRLMEQLEGVAGRQFSALVTVTPSIAVRFLSRNSRTVLVHNFPDLSEAGEGLKRPWDQRAESIAYVGGILPERGVREMIQAMALLPETLACRLQIATDDFPNGLLRQVSSAPGWARVDHVGYLSRGQVADLLGRVRAGIVIFHPEPNNVTAMPNKLFEYMAAGIPVIASDFPLWREIVEGANCGILVDPLCPRSIAQAIEYLLTHPVEAEAMGGRGRMAVENSYNWNTEARKLLDLYSCLMDPACAG